MEFFDKKGFLQMSFQWIFAIIVGIVIISLVIYGVVRFMDIEQGKQDAQKSLQVESLLNPTEIGFESGTSHPIEMKTETEINLECEDFGEWGEQKISVKQKNFESTSGLDNYISSNNRYIFSDKTLKSKKSFYLFTKPFDFPFKVADLNYLTSENNTYCFQNPPEDIKEELEEINQPNLIIDDCENKEEVIQICFNKKNCDIDVDYREKVIHKEGEEMYFSNDALMYAGIFSSPEMYECQLKRLMKRGEKLSEIYIDKSQIISSVCSSEGIQSGLVSLRDSQRRYNESKDMGTIENQAQSVDKINDASWGCKLW